MYVYNLLSWNVGNKYSENMINVKLDITFYLHRFSKPPTHAISGMVVNVTTFVEHEIAQTCVQQQQAPPLFLAMYSSIQMSELQHRRVTERAQCSPQQHRIRTRVVFVASRTLYPLRHGITTQTVALSTPESWVVVPWHCEQWWPDLPSRV